MRVLGPPGPEVMRVEMPFALPWRFDQLVAFTTPSEMSTTGVVNDPVPVLAVMLEPVISERRPPPVPTRR